MANKFGLGRIRSEIDTRDYKLKNYIPEKMGDLSGSKNWDFPSEPLNQNETNHCVGFGGANFGINIPIQDNYTNKDGHDFYYKCKIVDGEPGAEDGSTVRSIAKVLRMAGRIDHYAFASFVNEITYWLLNNGPVIVGTDWTEDMFTPDENNIIHPTGDVVGGHCYLLNEKTENNLYGIQNSWGDEWGIKGKAYISIDDFVKLSRNYGEAVTAVEMPLPIVSGSKENFFITFIKDILRALGFSI